MKPTSAHVLVIIALFGPFYAKGVDEKQKAPLVLVQPAHRSELFDVLSYPARVVPQINAIVLTESEGLVTRIHAPLGSKVVKGQRILVLKHTDPIYRYAPVTVTAPVSGIVSLIDVSEGTLVTRGQKVATVTDPSKVRVVVELAASDIASVRAGMRAEFKRPSEDKPLSMRVKGMSPFVDPATGTAPCELEALPGQTSSLAPGSVGQISFKVNSRQGFSLPEHAVVYRGSATFVRTIEHGRAKYNPVTLGRKSRGMIEVTQGLHEGSQVIERAGSFIAEGEEVAVQAQEKKL